MTGNSDSKISEPSKRRLRPHPVLHELLVTKRLLQSNVLAIFGTFLSAVLARYLVIPVSFDKFISALLNTAAFCFVYAYIFDIANQAWFSEEDRLNKPNRPIPAGLITVKQACHRWIFSWTIGPLVLNWCYGGGMIVYMVIWQFVVFYCYVWPKPSHWAMKNAFNGASTLLGLRMVNLVVRSVVSQWNLPLAFDCIGAIWVLVSVHVQDFSEVKGDLATGRRTLPIVLSSRGLKYLRIGTAAYFIMCGGTALLWGIIHFWTSSRLFYTILATGICQFAIQLCVAIRVLFGGEAEKDKRTYHKYYTSSFFLFLIHVAFLVAGREDALESVA